MLKSQATVRAPAPPAAARLCSSSPPAPQPLLVVPLFCLLTLQSNCPDPEIFVNVTLGSGSGKIRPLCLGITSAFDWQVLSCRRNSSCREPKRHRAFFQPLDSGKAQRRQLESFTSTKRVTKNRKERSKNVWKKYRHTSKTLKVQFQTTIKQISQ